MAPIPKMSTPIRSTTKDIVVKIIRHLLLAASCRLSLTLPLLTGGFESRSRLRYLLRYRPGE